MLCLRPLGESASNHLHQNGCNHEPTGFDVVCFVTCSLLICVNFLVLRESDNKLMQAEDTLSTN